MWCVNKCNVSVQFFGNVQENKLNANRYLPQTLIKYKTENNQLVYVSIDTNLVKLRGRFNNQNP
jgi:hypothetical protein